jgi:hypothetical protein
MKKMIAALILGLTIMSTGLAFHPHTAHAAAPGKWWIMSAITGVSSGWTGTPVAIYIGPGDSEEICMHELYAFWQNTTEPRPAGIGVEHCVPDSGVAY